jgi:hypothetical protein
VARVVLVEGPREADIFIETTPRPPATGKPERWGKSKGTKTDLKSSIRRPGASSLAVACLQTRSGGTSQGYC